MGRPPKNKGPVEVAAKAPVMKYGQAMKLADKNARTIMKISQLMKIVHLPGYAQADPKDRVGAHIVNLRTRMNRRLMKLAKWADSSSDERHAEFRNSANSNYPYRTLIKPMLYSKPIPVSDINRMKGVKIPAYYSKASLNAVSKLAAAPAAIKDDAVAPAADEPTELQQQ